MQLRELGRCLHVSRAFLAMAGTYISRLSALCRLVPHSYVPYLYIELSLTATSYHGRLKFDPVQLVLVEPDDLYSASGGPRPGPR